MLSGQQGYPQNNQQYGQPQQGGYGQNYNQGYGQVPPQNQGNYQQGYNNQQAPQMGVLGTGQWSLQSDRELYCKCIGTGMMFAKKGAMVAYEGQFKFSKRLLGTNQGNIVGQVINHAARKLTGENLEIMEINGSGTVYLADLAQHVTVIDLEGNGPWNSLCVESENLLGFTAQCHYGVTPIGVGVISQKGLFTSKLTYNGPGAKVAITTNGNPLVLTVGDSPIYVDPDAMVCFTGSAPGVKADVGLKTLIGQTSGESYQLEFKEKGQIVVVQPYERESGLSIRDTTRPTSQAKPTFGSGGASGSTIENGIGDMLGKMFN